MRIGRVIGRAAGAVVIAAAAATAVAPAATSGSAALYHKPIAVLGANQSGNWSGYNQGTLEHGNQQFSSIAGTWVVPTVTQHKAGEAEYSSSWVGIGGGCVNTGCTVTDNTLIQAGTEQDVSASGQASYSAWWEIIPEPSTPVSLPVAAGNTITTTISEGLPGQWTIVIQNVSTGKSVTVNTPYSSTHLTAEWIEETPLIISTNGGFAPLPNLTTVNFDKGTTNGAAPSLGSSEQIQLVDNSGHVIAQPSNPDADTDGFNDCAWATTCATPAS